MMLCDVAGGPPARWAAVLCEPAAIVAGAAARDDLKAYLRIEGGAEDALLDRLLGVAIGHGEAFTGRLFLIRQVNETAAAGPAWRRLAWGPVRAIESSEALATDGSATALRADARAIEIDGGGDGWVRVTLPGGGRVRTSYRAGLAADWAGLPDPLRQGAVRLAAHLHAHRDAADEGAPPAAVAALWRPWRRVRLI